MTKPRQPSQVRAAGSQESGLASSSPYEFRLVRSVAASYEGHFRHGNSFRLRQQFHHRFPWLVALNRRFDHRLEGQRVSIEIAP